MSELSFTSRPRFPVALLLCGIVTIGLVGLSLALKEPGYAITATLPAGFALWAWSARPRPISGRLSRTALELDDGTSAIPYADVVAVSVERRYSRRNLFQQREFAVFLEHADRASQIPARLSLPSDRLYEALLARIGFSGVLAESDALATHRREQSDRFGAERVYAFRGRARVLSNARLAPRRCAALFAVVGALWILFGAIASWMEHESYSGWIGTGVVLLMLAGFSFLIAIAQASALRAATRGANLVIGPAGIALVQGKLRGEMRWQELRKIEWATRRGSFQYDRGTSGPHLRLSVEGGSIPIQDVFSRPLDVIYRLIILYWRGEFPCPICGTPCTPATGPICRVCHPDVTGGSVITATPASAAKDTAD